MGEIVASAVAQEGVSIMSSYISTKLEDKASRAHILERLELAVLRMAFYLERAGKMPIASVPLIGRWNWLVCRYKEGVNLLNKHKLQAPEGHEETGQVVVRGSSSSYLQWIARAARLFFISSLAGLNKECLSSSVVQNFESYADSADKFVTDVESVCPLRRDTFFPYPFVRQLLEGKTLRYERIQGRQRLTFSISPLISEGRGIEAELRCKCFDPERLDKEFCLDLILRLSESTDIVETVIGCLRSSALQNPVAPDAIIRELALLSNLQDEISSAYCYDRFLVACRALFSSHFRQDPLCCQSNGHVESTKSSELSQIHFQEQIIYFHLICHVPALEYSLPSASDEAGRNVMADGPPLKLSVSFVPHYCLFNKGWVYEDMGGKKEVPPFGDIQQTVDMVRSRSVDCLINQSEITKYSADWFSRHGKASFHVEKSSTDMATVPKVRSRYNTRSGGKRKRPVEARGRYNTRSGRATLSTS